MVTVRQHSSRLLTLNSSNRAVGTHQLTRNKIRLVIRSSNHLVTNNRRLVTQVSRDSSNQLVTRNSNRLVIRKTHHHPRPLVGTPKLDIRNNKVVTPASQHNQAATRSHRSRSLELLILGNSNHLLLTLICLKLVILPASLNPLLHSLANRHHGRVHLRLIQTGKTRRSDQVDLNTIELLFQQIY